MKELVASPEAPTPVGPYSPALRVGDWIYLSGQGAFDPSTGAIVSDDVEEQTAQVFRNIGVLLAAAGADLDDVVSCLVHLSDLSDFSKVNRVYEKHFIGTRPTRTTVRADLVEGMKVEITAIAHRGSEPGEASPERSQMIAPSTTV